MERRTLQISGNMTCGFGGLFYRIECDFIGIGIAGLIAGEHSDTDTLGDRFCRRLDNLFFDINAVRNFIFKIEVGIITASHQGNA